MKGAGNLRLAALALQLLITLQASRFWPVCKKSHPIQQQKSVTESSKSDVFSPWVCPQIFPNIIMVVCRLRVYFHALCSLLSGLQCPQVLSITLHTGDVQLLHHSWLETLSLPRMCLIHLPSVLVAAGALGPAGLTSWCATLSSWAGGVSHWKRTSWCQPCAVWMFVPLVNPCLWVSVFPWDSRL